MKWSRYNEIIDDDNQIILFNTFRKKYIAFDVNLKDLILKGFNNVNTIAEVHPELYNCLLFEKFILPDDTDEKDECVQEINRRFSSKSNLRITINPTLDCNLRCWYCYESHIKGSCMKQDIINGIIRFLQIQLTSKDIKNIQLSFFGGEPLLKYKKVIKPIVTKCSEICKAHGKNFSLHFTTNGVCLTPNVIDELLNIGISFSVQVAFDGNKEQHDNVKCFPNGKGCYDIVKKNLDYAIEKGIITTIRCNYTNSNIESFIEVLKDFEGYWHYSNVRFSFYKVWQETDSEELFRKIKKITKYVGESGIRSNVNSYYGDSINPCYADYDNNIVINYNGDIFKCTARDFKKEHRIGYIDESGNIIYNAEYKERIEMRLTKQCPSCRLLPICTTCSQHRSESIDGNCPTPILRKNATINIKKYFYDITKLYDRQTQNNF